MLQKNKKVDIGILLGSCTAWMDGQESDQKYLRIAPEECSRGIRWISGSALWRPNEDGDLSVVRQRHCRQVGVLSQEQEMSSSCHWEAPEDVFGGLYLSNLSFRPNLSATLKTWSKVFEGLANKSKWDKSRLPHWNPQLTLTFHIFHSFHQSIFVQQHNWHICWLSKLSPFISKIEEEVTQLSS